MDFRGRPWITIDLAKSFNMNNRQINETCNKLVDIEKLNLKGEQYLSLLRCIGFNNIFCLFHSSLPCQTW